MYTLFIDDSRTIKSIASRIQEPFDESQRVILVKNREQLLQTLRANGSPVFISFDYWLDPRGEANVLSEGFVEVIGKSCLAENASFPLFDVHSSEENASARINQKILEFLDRNPELRGKELNYDLLARRRSRVKSSQKKLNELPEHLRAILGLNQER